MRHLGWSLFRAKGSETRVVYRAYATLYFVFVVDGGESELGVLDLIQVREPWIPSPVGKSTAMVFNRAPLGIRGEFGSGV